jgi:hypothetical protein
VKLVDSRRPVGKVGETQGVFLGVSIGDRACAVNVLHQPHQVLDKNVVVATTASVDLISSDARSLRPTMRSDIIRTYGHLTNWFCHFVFPPLDSVETH